MKPKTKVEKEVAMLSGKLPSLSEYQKKWAERLAKYENAHTFNGKKTDIIHFIIATTKGDWQVLRHFYLYYTYRYKKPKSQFYLEVMQQWYKDGEYVFLCRSRNPFGYHTDAWSVNSSLEIRRGRVGGYYLRDPRDIGYDKVYYARLQRRFFYIPKDDKCDNRIDDMFRALNTHPFNETLFKHHRAEWLWSINSGFVFDKERTAAIKVAMRHGYDFMNEEWRDMVEMLQYLGKDLHNPHFVCPPHLHQAHNEVMQCAQRKREKIRAKIAKATQVRMEREQLRRMERQARYEQERKEAEKAAVTLYPKARGKFFGLLITDGELEIRVLQSVNEFFEEGKEMHHCVFAAGYYDVKKRPNSLILSAKVNGERKETLEVDLSRLQVVQCRGKDNQPTEYHDRIMRLMEKDMHLIRQVI